MLGSARGVLGWDGVKSLETAMAASRRWTRAFAVCAAAINVSVGGIGSRNAQPGSGNVEAIGQYSIVRSQWMTHHLPARGYRCM